MNENKRALSLIVFIVALGAVLIQTKKTSLSSDITNDEIMDHIGIYHMKTGAVDIQEQEDLRM